VLQALQTGFDIEDEDLWRLATGLGAGMSRKQTLCGAMSGAAMSCGLIFGRRRHSSREDRKELKEETYKAVQTVTRHFEEKFGSLECRTLTGCDFSSPEGNQAFTDGKILDRVCLPAVRFAVEAAYSVLNERS
jgi:C_GCAxxG_C_C family probable redox protein